MQRRWRVGHSASIRASASSSFAPDRYKIWYACLSGKMSDLLNPARLSPTMFSPLTAALNSEQSIYGRNVEVHARVSADHRQLAYLGELMDHHAP